MKILFLLFLILPSLAWSQTDSLANKICIERGHISDGVCSTTLMYCPPYTIDTDSTTVMVYPACNYSTYTCTRCSKSVTEKDKEHRITTWKKTKTDKIVKGGIKIDTASVIKQGDSLRVKPKYYHYYLKQDTAFNLGYATEWKLKQNIDTISVIMLICDTSKKTEHVNTYLGLKGTHQQWKTETVQTQDNSVYWQYGYSVKRRYFNGQAPEFIKYLDNNKQVLKPEIVVWESKEVKQ